jgi:GPH family glycoside/pentoside/hexuronide:cation symporter
MFWAAVPMGLGLIMIWSPPLGLGPSSMLIWMGVALIAYETASTAFFVPHGALGVELTPNHHERTRLFGYGHMIGAIGMVLGLLSLQMMNWADDKRAFAFELSVGAGAIVALLILITTRWLPERADYQGRGGQHIVRAFADIVRNKHSRLLLLVFGIETFGAASIGMLVPYLVEYVIPMQNMMVPILLAYTIPQFVLTPIWIRLSYRFGKKQLWLASMVISAVAFTGFAFITEVGPAIWVLTILVGIAGGCGAVVAPSIKADIIDYDEFLTHERKEGAYLAVWNLVRKCAASVTAFITGWVLQTVGFEPNVEQTEEVKLAIQLLFGALPAICYVIGAIIFTRFSFNEAEHRAVRQELDARRMARTSG